MRVCVNRNRGRYCFLFCNRPILNDIRGHSDPKNIRQIAENRIKFFKMFWGGSPPALAPSALGSGLRPFTGSSLSKIPGSAPGLCVCLSQWRGRAVQNSWTDRGPVWGGDSWGPKKPDWLPTDSTRPVQYYFVFLCFFDLSYFLRLWSILLMRSQLSVVYWIS